MTLSRSCLFFAHLLWVGTQLQIANISQLGNNIGLGWERVLSTPDLRATSCTLIITLYCFSAIKSSLCSLPTATYFNIYYPTETHTCQMHGTSHTNISLRTTRIFLLLLNRIKQKTNKFSSPRKRRKQYHVHKLILNKLRFRYYVSS